MLSCNYEKIFSRFRNKIDDPKEMSLNENDLIEIYTERLHSVVGDPFVRPYFTNLKLDDEIQVLSFELSNPVDDDSDMDFIIELFTLGMEIQWFIPKVRTTTAIHDVFGGKEEKYLKNPYKTNVEELKNLENKFHKKLRDYGYIHNSYVEGG